MKDFVTLLGYTEALGALQQVRDRWRFPAGWQAYTDVSYAVHQEFGTKKMQGKFYLRRAADRTIRNVEAIPGVGAISAFREQNPPDKLLELIAWQVVREAKRPPPVGAPVDTGNLRGSISAERV